MRFNVTKISQGCLKLFPPCDGAKYDRESEEWYVELDSLEQLLTWVDERGYDVSISPLDEDDEYYYLIIEDRSW